ncbi:hypothetical protein F1C16_20525 (plasmid) [Hymenobacter sp. NBH84]|uniref:hypothetical protein n=1 Tax=Hymenobacter sp. NBH84 TaxID=2596915 RepID=UPI001628A87E|nr:hypothetical protein [Hymenobacter sp. NBH84]QNE42012.1 hypothetical protein F1C16_20525 [Hymenobacter sp. NBH84]
MISPTLLLFVDVDPKFFTACEKSLTTVQHLCQGVLMPSFLGIALITTIGRGYLQSNSLSMDFSPLLKGLWLYLLIGFYSEWATLIGDAIGGFVGLLRLPTAGDSAGQAIYQILTPGSLTQNSAGQTVSMAEFIDRAGSLLSNLNDAWQSFSFVGLLTRFFTATTVLVVRNVMLYIRQFVLGFLYVSGPITLSLSVIPAFAQLAKHWLQNFVSVHLWSLTFAVLDLLYSFYAQQQTQVEPMLPGTQQADQDTSFLIMSVAFVVLYFMVPYLTSLVIGGSAVQGFLASFGGMVAGAATAAAGVVAPGGGGLSSALGRIMGNGRSAGSGGGGNSGAAEGHSNAEHIATTPAAENSAAASLPRVTMAEALNPTYQQRSSGIWTR